MRWLVLLLAFLVQLCSIQAAFSIFSLHSAFDTLRKQLKTGELSAFAKMIPPPMPPPTPSVFKRKRSVRGPPPPLPPGLRPNVIQNFISSDIGLTEKPQSKTPESTIPRQSNTSSRKEPLSHPSPRTFPLHPPPAPPLPPFWLSSFHSESGKPSVGEQDVTLQPTDDFETEKGSPEFDSLETTTKSNDQLVFMTTTFKSSTLPTVLVTVPITNDDETEADYEPKKPIKRKSPPPIPPPFPPRFPLGNQFAPTTHQPSAEKLLHLTLSSLLAFSIGPYGVALSKEIAGFTESLLENTNEHVREPETTAQLPTGSFSPPNRVDKGIAFPTEPPATDDIFSTSKTSIITQTDLQYNSTSASLIDITTFGETITSNTQLVTNAPNATIIPSSSQLTNFPGTLETLDIDVIPTEVNKELTSTTFETPSLTETVTQTSTQTTSISSSTETSSPTTYLSATAEAKPQLETDTALHIDGTTTTFGFTEDSSAISPTTDTTRTPYEASTIAGPLLTEALVETNTSTTTLPEDASSISTEEIFTTAEETTKSQTSSTVTESSASMISYVETTSEPKTDSQEVTTGTTVLTTVIPVSQKEPTFTSNSTKESATTISGFVSLISTTKDDPVLTSTSVSTALLSESTDITSTSSFDSTSTETLDSASPRTKSSTSETTATATSDVIDESTAALTSSFGSTSTQSDNDGTFTTETRATESYSSTQPSSTTQSNPTVTRENMPLLPNVFETTTAESNFTTLVSNTESPTTPAETASTRPETTPLTSVGSLVSSATETTSIVVLTPTETLINTNQTTLKDELQTTRTSSTVPDGSVRTRIMTDPPDETTTDFTMESSTFGSGDTTESSPFENEEVGLKSTHIMPRSSTTRPQTKKETTQIILSTTSKAIYLQTSSYSTTTAEIKTVKSTTTSSVSTAPAAEVSIETTSFETTVPQTSKKLLISQSTTVEVPTTRYISDETEKTTFSQAGSVTTSSDQNFTQPPTQSLLKKSTTDSMRTSSTYKTTEPQSTKTSENEVTTSQQISSVATTLNSTSWKTTTFDENLSKPTIITESSPDTTTLSSLETSIATEQTSTSSATTEFPADSTLSTRFGSSVSTTAITLDTVTTKKVGTDSQKVSTDPTSTTSNVSEQSFPAQEPENSTSTYSIELKSTTTKSESIITQNQTSFVSTSVVADPTKTTLTNSTLSSTLSTTKKTTAVSTVSSTTTSTTTQSSKNDSTKELVTFSPATEKVPEQTTNTVTRTTQSNNIANASAVPITATQRPTNMSEITLRVEVQMSLSNPFKPEMSDPNSASAQLIWSQLEQALFASLKIKVPGLKGLILLKLSPGSVVVDYAMDIDLEAAENTISENLGDQQRDTYVELLESPQVFVEQVLQSRSLQESVGRELLLMSKNRTESGDAPLRLTSGFTPIVTEVVFDQQTAFEQFCLNNCQDETVLVLPVSNSSDITPLLLRQNGTCLTLCHLYPCPKVHQCAHSLDISTKCEFDSYYFRETYSSSKPVIQYLPDCRFEASIPPWAVALAVILPVALLCGIGLAVAMYRLRYRPQSDPVTDDRLADHEDVIVETNSSPED